MMHNIIEWLKEYAEVIGLVLTVLGGVYSLYGAIGVIICVAVLAMLGYILCRALGNNQESTDEEKSEPIAKKEAETVSEEKLTTIEGENSQPYSRIKKHPPMSDSDFVKLCESGDARKVEEAIMNGANVHARANDGSTALMRVAQLGYTEIAEVLLNHGADVNAKDDNGWTVLKVAAFAGHTETTELLLKHGADVNARDNDYRTVLMDATFDGHTEIAKILLNYGADVNAKYAYSMTALMWAAKFGYTEIAELLLNHGADVNAKDYWGNTALMHAASEGQTETAELLLKHSADVNAKANNGRTALMDAKDGKTKQLLRKYGAKEYGFFGRLFSLFSAKE